jgi:hypothetical protein
MRTPAATITTNYSGLGTPEANVQQQGQGHSCQCQQSQNAGDSGVVSANVDRSGTSVDL